MKKIIVWGLLLAGLIYLGVNWYTKNNQIDDITTSEQPVDTVYPDSEPLVNTNDGGDESTLSQSTKHDLLFDAPATARYIDSSASGLSQDKSLLFDPNGNGDKKLILGLDHPNGVRVLVLNGDKGQNLINEVPDGPFFNDYGDLKSDNYIQVTLVDLKGDGSKNIVIAIGKYNRRVDVSIFGLADDKSSYNYLGSIESSSSVKFTDGKIVVCREDDTKAYKLQNNSIVEVH